MTKVSDYCILQEIADLASGIDDSKLQEKIIATVREANRMAHTEFDNIYEDGFAEGRNAAIQEIVYLIQNCSSIEEFKEKFNDIT